MATAAEMEAKIEKLETNMTRFDGIVNGDDDDTITTDNGPVPSVANLFAQLALGVNIVDDDWSIGLSITVQDIYTVDGLQYRALSTHTSASTDEPGVGVNWEDYWALWPASIANLEAKVDLLVADTADLVAQAVAQALVWNTQRVGKQTTPVTSAIKLSNSVLVFPEPIKWNGSRLKSVVIRTESAGTLIPQSRSRTLNSSNLVQKDKDLTVTVTGAGLHTYTRADFGDIFADKGDMGGFWCSSAMVAATANSDGTPYLAVTTATDDATVSDTSEARDYFIEAYMIWEGPTGASQRIDLLEVSTNQAKEVGRALLGRRGEPGITGIKADFATSGSLASGGHLLYEGPKPYWRLLDKFEHYSAVETWALFWIGTVSGSIVTIQKFFNPVKINEGLNTHDWLKDIALAPGEMLGRTCHANGVEIYTTGSPPAEYEGIRSVIWTSLSSNQFTDSTIDTNNVIQARLSWRKVTPSLEADILWNERSVPTTLLKPTAPDPTSVGSMTAGSIAFKLNLPDTFLCEEIRWESINASNVRWSLGVWDGTDWVITKRLDTAAKSYGAGKNVFYYDGKIEPGQALIGQGYTSGWIRQKNDPHDGWDYAALPGGDVYPESFTPSISNAAQRAELQITGRRLGGEKHTINNQNSDKIEILGPSYTAECYGLENQTWTAYVSERTDWRIEAHGFSGETLFNILGRLRNGTWGSYPNVHYKDLGATYVAVMEAYNSWDHPTNNRTDEQYKDDADKFIETARGDGYDIIFIGEARRVYGTAGHGFFRELAEKHNAQFVNVVEHTLIYDNGTKYNGFYQAAGSLIDSDYHYGTRSAMMLAAPLVRHINQKLFHYSQGYKAYRLRTESAGFSDANDLIPRNRITKAKHWQEIRINHTAISDATKAEFDKLTGGTYTPNTPVQSEYLKFQLGQTVVFPDDGMFEYTLDAVRKNVAGIRFQVSDPTISVYVMSARVSPAVDTIGKSANQWLLLTGLNGVYELSQQQLAGIMAVDKIFFYLHKVGGFTITEPKFNWFGTKGKPMRQAPTAARVRKLGSELLTQTLCHNHTDWDVEGSPTASTTTTFQLPYGKTGYTLVNDVDKLVQDINLPINNYKDTLVRVWVESRVMPIPFVSGTFPADSQISLTSWNDREVLVEILAPGTETVVFSQTLLATRWMDWEEVFFTLPMRVTGYQVRVGGISADDIQIFEVSTKEVQELH